MQLLQIQMKMKWNSISLKTASFEELQEIQKKIPIRVSIPQTIEWLIKVGQQQINQSGTINENTQRISK